MVPSAVINEAIVFLTALAMKALIRSTPKESLPETFRYFTVLSNLLCGLTALILLLCELFGTMPLWAVALKYMGAAAVTVTLATVFLYLLPVTKNPRGLLGDLPKLIMHLLTPILAILSFACFERKGLSAWVIPLGILPSVLYGGLYIQRAIITKTWEDMYGFNRGGRWKQRFSVLTLGAAVVAVLLWVL